MKRILLIFVILIGFGTLQAQEQTQEQTVIGPAKGTVTVSLLLGNASTYATSALPSSSSDLSYNVTSPYFQSSNGYNGLVNMLGVEGKWFFSNTLALRFSGATMLNSIPAYEGVPGVNTGNLANIPTYEDVPARSNADVIINMGIDKYFATKNSHLFWYASPVINFQYGRKTGFDVSGVDPTQDPGTTRYAEQFVIGLSGIMGAEYYTTSGIVFGFELRGISYMYVRNSILPSEGLKPLMSDSQNITFLSQPTVKIGFRF